MVKSWESLFVFVIRCCCNCFFFVFSGCVWGTQCDCRHHELCADWFSRQELWMATRDDYYKCCPHVCSHWGKDMCSITKMKPSGQPRFFRIGHFRVHFSLNFKTSLRVSLFWISVFIHIEIRTNYRNENFALRLPLKERPRGTEKCSTVCLACENRDHRKCWHGKRDFEFCLDFYCLGWIRKFLCWASKPESWSCWQSTLSEPIKA